MIYLLARRGRAEPGRVLGRNLHGGADALVARALVIGGRCLRLRGVPHRDRSGLKGFCFPNIPRRVLSRHHSSIPAFQHVSERFRNVVDTARGSVCSCSSEARKLQGCV